MALLPDGSPGAAALLGLLDRSGGGVESRVRGGSMHPTLPDGVRIRIRAGVAFGSGDVVALATPAGLVAHRVVARGRSRRANGWIITRGDARIACEPPVRQETIAGVVVARTEQGDWSAPPPAPRRTPVRALLAAIALLVPRASMEVHPRAGIAVNAAFVVAARLLSRGRRRVRAADRS